MSIGLLALNAAIASRLTPLLPSGMGLAVGYAPENLTDLAAPISCHVVPDGARPYSDTGPNARLMAGYTLYVFLDQERIDTTQEAAAYQFFDDALAALLGWAPGGGAAECRFVSTQTPMAYDGRIGRLEISIEVPVYIRRVP